MIRVSRGAHAILLLAIICVYAGWRACVCVWSDEMGSNEASALHAVPARVFVRVLVARMICANLMQLNQVSICNRDLCGLPGKQVAKQQAHNIYIRYNAYDTC